MEEAGSLFLITTLDKNILQLSTVAVFSTSDQLVYFVNRTFTILCLGFNVLIMSGMFIYVFVLSKAN